MPVGMVKWFNTDKGFWFTLQDNGGPDLFVHSTGITGDGHRGRHEAQKVNTAIVQGYTQARYTTPA
nr:cold shock domain-containing protein [Streptomyces chartreusis]